MTWTIELHEVFKKRVAKVHKKHGREVQNMLLNLDQYVKALQTGARPLNIRPGYIHIEQAGVVAIDQRGKGKGLKQFRLYVYPDEDSKTLHVLTVGDKKSQPNDVKAVSAFVKRLRSSRADDQTSSE